MRCPHHQRHDKARREKAGKLALKTYLKGNDAAILINEVALL
jgi:hypothetical protein